MGKTCKINEYVNFISSVFSLFWLGKIYLLFTSKKLSIHMHVYMHTLGDHGILSSIYFKRFDIWYIFFYAQNWFLVKEYSIDISRTSKALHRRNSPCINVFEIVYPISYFISKNQLSFLFSYPWIIKLQSYSWFSFSFIMCVLATIHSLVSLLSTNFQFISTPSPTSIAGLFLFPMRHGGL